MTPIRTLLVTALLSSAGLLAHAQAPAAPDAPPAAVSPTAKPAHAAHRKAHKATHHKVRHVQKASAAKPAPM